MTGKELSVVCTDLDKVVDVYSLAAIEGKGRFEKMFAMASGVQKLRELITPDLMKPIMQLQNTKLGFRTDAIYKDSIVKDCLIEAVLRGLQPVGNQFNIICGQTYITKEGFTHLLKEFPGFSSLRLDFGVPKIEQSGALVDVTGSWILNGVVGSLTRKIPVKLQSGMGSDAALGKAERKMKASIYAQITGQDLPDGEADDRDTITPEYSKTGPVETMKEKIARTKAAAKSTETPPPDNAAPFGGQTQHKESENHPDLVEARLSVSKIPPPMLAKIKGLLRIKNTNADLTFDQCLDIIGKVPVFEAEESLESERGF